MSHISQLYKCHEEFRNNPQLGDQRLAKIVQHFLNVVNMLNERYYNSSLTFNESNSVSEQLLRANDNLDGFICEWYKTIK